MFNELKNFIGFTNKDESSNVKEVTKEEDIPDIDLHGYGYQEDDDPRLSYRNPKNGVLYKLNYNLEVDGKGYVISGDLYYSDDM